MTTLYITRIGECFFDLSDEDGTLLCTGEGMTIARELEVRGVKKQAALSAVNTADEFGSESVNAA